MIADLEASRVPIHGVVALTKDEFTAILTALRAAENALAFVEDGGCYQVNLSEDHILTRRGAAVALRSALAALGEGPREGL